MADSASNPVVTDITGLAKLAESELAKAVYRDGLQEATVEVGKLTFELTKTVRFALQPLFAAIQGGAKRLNDWVEEAVNSVPQERRVDAKPALLNSIVAAVGVEEDGTALRANYVRLLASMMDRDRQHDLHPSFPGMLQELSARDALLLQITPHGNGIPLPEPLARQNVRISTGLIQTLENFANDGIKCQQQRFFVGVRKSRENEDGVYTRLLDEMAKDDEHEHLGFLEFSVPVHFGPGEIHWSNLERLQLVTSSRPTFSFPPNHSPWMPTTSNHLENLLVPAMPTTSSHLKRLLAPPPATQAVYAIASRKELGEVFARCCIPDYSGKVEWHPSV